MELLHAFVVWVLAVGEHWHGYVSGTVLAFGLELIKKFREWEPSKRVFATIVAIGLIFSMFSTWHEEYEKTHPGLKLEIAEAGVADGRTKSDCKIFISASVKYNGAPSIADSWELSVQSPGHSPVKAETQYLDPNQPIKFIYPNEPEQKLSSEDILYNKTMKQPIQTGMKEVGFLSFELNMPRTEIEKKGTKFLLQCRDINGNVIQAEQSWEAGPPGRPRFIPGMSPIPK